MGWRRALAERLAPELVVERDRAREDVDFLALRLRGAQTVDQRVLRLEADHARNAAQVASAGVGTLNETISRLVHLLAELRFAADEVRTWIALDPGRAGRRLSRAIVAASQELPPGMVDPNPTPRDVVDSTRARFWGGA